MKLITQIAERRPNGQESTAAQACLHAANIQATIDGLGIGCGLDNVYSEGLSRSVNSENISKNSKVLIVVSPLCVPMIRAPFFWGLLRFYLISYLGRIVRFDEMLDPRRLLN